MPCAACGAEAIRYDAGMRVCLFPLAAIVFAAVTASLSAQSPEQPATHPRDLLAKTLIPIAQSFSSAAATGSGGLDAEFLVRRASTSSTTGMDVSVARVRLLVDAPARMMVEVTTPEAKFVLCRNGDIVWAAPRSFVEPLLARLGQPGSPEPVAALPDMRLPLDPTAIGFLPALLDVRDVGYETINGVPCRGIEAVPQPEIVAQFPPLAGWRLKVWIKPDNAQIVRFEAPGTATTDRLDILSIKSSLALPDSLWQQPDTPDAFSVPPQRITSLLGQLKTWMGLKSP